MQKTEIVSLDLENIEIISPAGEKVFENLNLQVPMSRFCWVKGHGGSGRSLFLRLLCGLADYASGSYKINGSPIEKMDFADLQKFRLNMGYSFDFGGLLGNRTLYENLILPLNYHSLGTPQEREERVHELVDAFRIDRRLLPLRPADVQGSIRKMVCVARAFIFQPEIVFLDDPTAGMNAHARVAFQTFMRQRKSHGLKHVFVTSDDADFWREFVDEVLLVDSGRVRSVGGLAA